ncbi:MAG: hypothetical protein J7M18_02715 [Candidatus Eremiobacteraeota bacterium]|nr:hypothetical protein [Candidatus Eremiobacteraeota bacterium]
MPVQIKLKNYGKKVLQVNRRFLLNDRKYFYELSLEIKDPHGNMVPLETSPQFLLPGSDDYMNLGPGKSISYRLDLNDFFIIVEPGEYHIRAYYRNFFSPPPGAAWIGTLESSEEIFYLKVPEMEGGEPR